MKVRMKDIAKMAGVSVATVSIALNNKNGVSNELKSQIKKMADELGYNKLEKRDSLLDNKIRFIIYKRHGYVISDTPFFTSLIEGIQKECRLNGYELVISHINKNEKDYKDILDWIKDNDEALGYLILATEMYPEDLKYFNTIKKPIVLLDSHFRDSNYDSVLINNIDAAYKATCYLADSGHEKIGYLHSSVFINNFYCRKIGFLEALNNKKIDINQNYIFELEPTMDGAYRDMKDILSKDETTLPTAFFADNDIIVFGAMKAIKEKGLKIPEDISLIGFDDMPFCEISNPKLSTVKVFKQEIGSLAIQLLIRKIKNSDKTITQKLEVGTELVIRDSVKQLS